MLDKFKIGEKVLVETVITSMVIDEGKELCEVKILGADDPEDIISSYVFLKELDNIHKIEE